MTVIVGIDPGLSGALCLLARDRLEIVDMPAAAGIDPYELARILINWGPVDRVCVERQQASPQQGRTSAFTTGRGFGMLEGVLAVLERPVMYVTPAVWTRDLHVGADKQLHIRRAKERWPQHDNLFLKSKDGRADAALIALWCAEQLRDQVA